MLKQYFAFIFLIFLAGVSVAVASDEVLRVDADIRYRWEYQDNFNQKFYSENPPKGDSDDGFLLQRVRLTVGYNPHRNVHFSAGVQDSRAYDVALSDDAFYNSGLGLEHNPYKDAWELFNTYLEMNNLFGQELSFKGGRQIIAYGDKRIFGPGEWGNTGRYAWDAVKLSYRLGGNFIDTFYGRNVIHEPDRFTLNHRHFFECFAVYSHFLIPGRNRESCLEPFFVRKWDARDNFKSEDNTFDDFNSNYYGVRGCGEIFPGFDYDLTVVRQTGNYGNDDIEAYGYHILAGYKFSSVSWEPRVSAEFSYASGDDDPQDGERGTFDGVFGARDSKYGRMNLMDWKNLQDAQLNLELKPVKSLGLTLELHKFWLAEEKDAWYLNQQVYRDKTGNSGNELGVEFDFIGKYITRIKGLEVQFGYGHFWPGKFVKRLADDVDANWCFLQLHYKLSKKVL
ncbi:MAG: alginate export family protein [Pseudomonadota bacterium]